MRTDEGAGGARRSRGKAGCHPRHGKGPTRAGDREAGRMPEVGARPARADSAIANGGILAGTVRGPGLPGIGSSVAQVGQARLARPVKAETGGAGVRFARGLDRPRPPGTLAAVGNALAERHRSRAKLDHDRVRQPGRSMAS